MNWLLKISAADRERFLCDNASVLDITHPVGNVSQSWAVQRTMLYLPTISLTVTIRCIACYLLKIKAMVYSIARTNLFLLNKKSNHEKIKFMPKTFYQ